MLTLALLVASALGLALSLHAWRLTARAKPPSVMATPYARILGLPNSAISAAYFAALIAFAVGRLARGPALPIWPALGASALSLGMTAYLAWALFVRLRRF